MSQSRNIEPSIAVNVQDCSRGGQRQSRYLSGEEIGKDCLCDDVIEKVSFAGMGRRMDVDYLRSGKVIE